LNTGHAHVSVGIWLTETDPFGSSIFLKVRFLIIEIEILPLKMKIGPLVNQKFQFGFWFNGNSTKTWIFINQHGE
jgi:hypothetical protein